MDWAQESEILFNLRDAVIAFDEDRLKQGVKKVIAYGFSAKRAIFEGLVPGMEEVGRLYDAEVYYIPELLMCSDVFYLGIDLLKEHLVEHEINLQGTIMIGVVEGDIHDIGKNIIKIMLEIIGFKVYDLGRDVAIDKFLNEHKRLKPDVVCLSSMMTTTMTEIKKIIKKLKKRNPNVLILVGGAPINDDIAHKWGAYACAHSVEMAKQNVIKALHLLKKVVDKPSLEKE